MRIYHLRSEHRDGCFPEEDIGYSSYCHEYSSGAESEGLLYQKTTLNGALGNDTGCPTMTSTTDFPTSGGSIIVGTEQIDYTAISGNTLTPCTRGANDTTRASHTNGSNVHLLVFGNCLDGPSSNYGTTNPSNSSWLWGNLYKATIGSSGIASNNVFVPERVNDNDAPYYGIYDYQSYSQRPNNWQYRNDGSAYSYVPYTYPHPLRGEAAITTVTGVTISGGTLR
jgi:hypothetical protein